MSLCLAAGVSVLAAGVFVFGSLGNGHILIGRELQMSRVPETERVAKHRCVSVGPLGGGGQRCSLSASGRVIVCSVRSLWKCSQQQAF